MSATTPSFKAMLYKKTLRTLLAFLLFASQAAAQQGARRPGVVEAERLRRHVTYLASDKLEGRRTGTGGAIEAALYVAEEFKRLGLTADIAGSADVQMGRQTFPVAFKGYFQMFPYVAGVE